MHHVQDIKIWHDHSSIANHGYLLVMVSLIYDPAFFYTRQEITDIVRFFHGDGPAAQFEAGNKQGGHYCCVGCGAHSGRFSDIAYCYRAPKRNLQERQEFVLKGKAWRKGGKCIVCACIHIDCGYMP